MSPYQENSTRSLRTQTWIRGCIISYGIGASTLLTHFHSQSNNTADFSFLHLFFSGLGLQALVFLIRLLVTRYEKQQHLAGEWLPLVMYITQLTADAVTIFLFALATFQGTTHWIDAL